MKTDQHFLLYLAILLVSCCVPVNSLIAPILSTSSTQKAAVARPVNLNNIELDLSNTLPQIPPTAFDTKDEIFASLLGSRKARDLFFAHHFGKSTVHVDRSSVELASPLNDIFQLSQLYDACEFINLRRRGSCDLLDKSKTSLVELEGYIKEGGSAVIAVVEPETNEFYHLKQSLQDFFGHQLSFNIYHSGPNGVALLPHYDSYDVFVLQLEGEKSWDVEVDKGSKETFALTLVPGDMLYMPQGIIHSAKTASGFASTTHLTIGIEKPRPK